MRVAIHQPNFLPRLKVLQKIAAADLWVVLDSVQYNEREWQNRARIVPIDGKSLPYWLSVPVHRPRGQGTLINEVGIVSRTNTTRLIDRSLAHAFKTSPFSSFLPILASAVDASIESESLSALCVETTSVLLSAAGVHVPIVYASSLPVSGKASVLMARLCQYVNATEYLADSGARNYLSERDFSSATVLWQDWQEPPMHWPGIESWRDISAVNFLFRQGAEELNCHLTNGRFTPSQSNSENSPTLHSASTK